MSESELQNYQVKPIGLVKSKTQSFLGITKVPETFLLILKPDDEEVLVGFVKVFK